MHLDPAGGFDGHFFEIRPRRLSQGASLFYVDEGKQEGKRQETDHHDRGDDLLLEAVRPAPEIHTGAFEGRATSAYCGWISNFQTAKHDLDEFQNLLI